MGIGGLEIYNNIFIHLEFSDLKKEGAQVARGRVFRHL